MAKVIYEQNLGELLSQLSADFLVVAPVAKKGHPSETVFKEFQKGDPLRLNYATTILPPKEFLLPPKEVLFRYKGGKAEKEKPAKTLLFGLSIEDLEGVSLLTKLFSEPVYDEPFMIRKEKTVIVGVDRFSPPKDTPFDLYLMEYQRGSYLAFSGSKEGQKILKNSLFKTQRVKPVVVKKKKDDLFSPALAEAVAGSKKHRVWDDLAKICFGCGICSYTCPLCYCFEVEDETKIKKEPEGQRCRTWDSCMLEHFAETSNHNFRPELRDRIYNWYYHKFVRIPAEYGVFGCVDCNRCTVYCPAKINYRQVLKRILTDYEAKK